jgi:hypothetical protein
MARHADASSGSASAKPLHVSTDERCHIADTEVDEIEEHLGGLGYIE